MLRSRVVASLLPVVGVAAVSACSSDGPLNVTTAEERGSILYVARRCGNCHGPDGTGITTFPGGPNIVGRTAADIRRQLTEPCATPDQVSDCHPLKIYDIESEQLTDLGAYLATLGGGFDNDNPGPVCSDVPGSICTVVGNGVSGNRNNPGLLGRVQNLFWPQNVAIDYNGQLVVTDWNNYIFRRLETPQTTEDCQEISDEFGGTGMDCPITRVVATGDLGDTCSTPENPVLAIDANMNHPVGVLYDDLIPGRTGFVMWGWHQWKIKYIPIDPTTGEHGQMYCLFGNDRGAGDDGVAAGWNFDGALGPTRFNLPSSAVIDNEKNWYISDQGNQRIRIIRPDADDNYTDPDLMVASLRNNIIDRWGAGARDEQGAFIKTASDYSNSGDGGPVFDATFNLQAGFDATPQFRLSIDRAGNRLFVADSENSRIRVVDLNSPDKIITTFAGGGEDVTGSFISPLAARLRRPADVDFNPDGSVLITDTFNHCVRLVDPTGSMIVTVAGVCGSDGSQYAGDGGPAVDALLQEPGGSVMDPATGIIYIADTLAHRIRKVIPPAGGYFAAPAAAPVATP